MEKISIVIPCYNEEECIEIIHKELNNLSSKMKYVDFEFLFVDDGSTDKTLEKLRQVSKQDNRTRYVSFSRNFGKESALYAGIKESTGDYIAVMDADLQDPPELLKEMYDIIKNEDYDCVATRRKNRKGEPIIRTFFAKLFYKIINKISKTEIVDGARDFRLMTRQMVNSILELKEYNRFSKGIFSWVGFKTKWLEYENIERVAGKTKWSFWGLFKYSIDAIVSFSTGFLTLSVMLGLILCLIAFVMILVVIIKTIIYGDPVTGWPSTICIILFIGGIQLLCMGIIRTIYCKDIFRSKK